MAAKHVKCVLVGDCGVGKRCLITTFTYSVFPEYVNTMMHPHSVSVTVGGKPIALELWYTAGQEDYDRLRPLSALSEKGRAPLTELQGHNLAQQIRAFKYVECSALTQDNLSQVFNDAACAVLDQKQRPKMKMMSFSSGRCSTM